MITNRPSKHAHKLVYEQAREIAHILYDEMMTNNPQVYDEWKKQNPELGSKALEARFVAKTTPKCLPAARATLAGMLNLPIDEGLKETIHEALVLDNTLLRGRG